MKKPTVTTPLATNSLSVSAIGQMLHIMLVKYLADIWVLSDEEVAFPLKKEQQERLLESLDMNDLAKLNGYMEAIINLMDDNMHGADAEDELSNFWSAASVFQVQVGSRQTKKIVNQTRQDLDNWREQNGMNA